MEVTSADKFEIAFSEAIKARSNALAVILSALFTRHQKRILSLAAKHRLPAIYTPEEFVENGGLMSYGADEDEPVRRIAIMIDKILKGTKPADIPVEQPTKFELIVNLKAATQIGYLDSSTAAGSAEVLDVFRKQMTQLNWIEGKNLTIAYRYAEGKGATRLAELAAELAGLKVDVIVVSASSTALAAKKATSTIPIVMASSVDPVGVGLIAGLARPGGNITGLAGFSDDLAGKRLEILKEVLPKSTRIGVISGTGGRGGEPQLKVMKEAASALGLKLVEMGSGSDAEKLLNAFRVAVREGVDGIITISAPVIFAQRQSIIVLAANHKLPAIYPQKEFVEDGGLMSYGEDRRDLYRHAAIYVDKILKGAKPSDLPVERPTKFEFFANLKAAKQIGLTIPPNVLGRADKVTK